MAWRAIKKVVVSAFSLKNYLRAIHNACCRNLEILLIISARYSVST